MYKCPFLFIKTAFLDDDLKEFILRNVQTPYLVEVNNKLTVYGTVLILIFLAQKYMIWTFCTSFFRNKSFIEIGYGSDMSDFQINQQKIFNEICGIGLPITQNLERISNSDEMYINEVLKRSLTLIFFDLEKSLKNKQFCTSEKIDSLPIMLKKNSFFDDKIISKIRRLRNCWFHGYFINDMVESEDGEFKFTLEFVISALEDLRDYLLESAIQFSKVIADINDFAISFYNYYVLRLIEVSFKILDNRLLTEDKLEKKLKNIEKAFNRFEKVDSKMFEMFSNLLNSNEILWSVSQSKFLDKVTRKFKCRKLKIIKLHSDSGFDIGNFHTEKTDIILANVEIYYTFKNLINGLDLNKIKSAAIRECSTLISVECFDFNKM